MRRAILLLTVLLAAAGSMAFAQNETPGVDLTAILTNPGFEQADNRPDPVGWRPFISGQGFELSRDSLVARTGQASARLIGRQGASDRSCYGQMTVPLKAPRYLRLRLWYRGTGSSDGFVRYRPVAGVKVPGDEYGTYPFRVKLPAADWQELVFDVKTPAAALAAEKVRLEVNFYQRTTGTLWVDDVSLEGFEKMPWTLALQEDVDPLAQHRRPADGLVVQQNPPDFSWSPQAEAEEYTFELSQDPGFPADKTIQRRLKYIYYSHSAVLATGTWYWRWRYATEDGTLSGWSRTTSFTLPAEAVPFPVPTVEEMRRAIPVTHPRIYTTAEQLSAFRAPLQTSRKQWWETYFRPNAERLLEEPVATEPPTDWIVGARPGGGPLTDELVAVLNKLEQHCFRIADRLEQLGFAYLISGDRRYADAAIAQLMEISRWDPEGVTSYRNTDRSFRALTFEPALAYDWCWAAMTPQQRQTIRQAIAKRGALFISRFRDGARPLYKYPYDSHAVTALNYLVLVSLALLHDEPVATEWFDFLMSVYPAMYPPWGDEDGGWAQGVSYWKWSMPDGCWVYDALKSLIGLDFYQKAHTRNNPWFKFYFQPPWCTSSHFGDGNPGAGADNTDRANLAHYAAVYKDPYLQWYALTPKPYSPNTYGPCSYWWYDEQLAPRPPADLPQGRWLRDIGWVAMHSDLSDPDDIMLMFKSSSYGSWNHSQADQNSFVVYGYGEPLLIDSGYYDWYGSPHDVGYTRQTKAHNDLLVNGAGQPVWDKGATGSITRYFSSRPVDYTCGDATPAYKGALQAFQRHILYLRPDVFVLLDEVKTDTPSEFTWALHALERMQLEDGKQEVTVLRGDSRCQVRFLMPERLRFELTDQFTPPLTTQRANQWHLYATTAAKATSAVFVTVVHPWRPGETGPLDLQTRREGDRMLISWPGGSAKLWIGPADKLPAGESRFTLSGDWQPGRLATAMVDGTRLSVETAGGAHTLLSSSVPATASAELSGKDPTTATVARVTLQLQDTGEVQLPFAASALADLLLDGKPLAADQTLPGQGDNLALRLPAGTHVIEVKPEETPAAASLEVLRDGQPVTTSLEALRRWDGSVLQWGTLSTDATPVRVEELQAPNGTQVSLGQGKLKVGQMLWPTGKDQLAARGPQTPGKISLSLRSVITDPKPIEASVEVSALESKPGVVKLEAEDFADSGLGTPDRYRTRAFLSGGIGVSSWTNPGMWMGWKWQVSKTGRYLLALRCATHETCADRWISMDGKGLVGDYRIFRFPNTGGYGATPEQWKTLAVTGEDGKPLTLSLTAGEHTLTMTCLQYLLNLDYLLLIPIE